MNVSHLILREIAHRKMNFLLAFLSVAMAVGVLVGAITLLKADAIRTEQLLAERHKEVVKAGAELKDSMRKITKGLGFNIAIFPKDQDLNELHLEGTASKTMPEEYVDRLAKSNLVTIAHLLPTVSKKIQWPEMNNYTVILIGTRGEVPIEKTKVVRQDDLGLPIPERMVKKAPKKKKPILETVAPGEMVVGYQVQKTLKLSPGDKVMLMGRPFEIRECYQERGTADDSTIWINLAEAQEMLGMQNLINAILALECNCTVADRVAEIREELARALPGTQVIERGPPALARAEARKKAAKAAEEALKREAADRERQRARREGFAAVLVPLVVLASAVWIAFLALNNVRQRRPEIGIFRAIGLRSSQIQCLFLGKAVSIGLAGAVLGYVAGFAVGSLWSELPRSSETVLHLFTPSVLVAALLIALLLSILGSWVPALLAARQDPAVVLQNE